MSSFRKISLLWLGLLGLLGATTLLPHTEIGTLALANECLRVLLFLISIYIVKKEPVRKNRFVFLNFAIVFFFSILHHIYNFIGPQGSIFVHETYARHYYYQYVAGIGFNIFFALAILYTVIDLLFREFRIYQKYLVSLAVVSFFAALYYLPYVNEPKYLYTTEDIRDWKSLDQARIAFMRQTSVEPTVAELARLVTLHAWKDGEPVGDLYAQKKVERIEYLYKYLPGDNYLVLLWKPMHKAVIYMNVACVFFIFLFFGYQYKKDPPQGAYIDKIMFLFLLFSGMEALHAWGYITAVEWETMTEIFLAGQYVTIGILVFMVLFFSLRLRFITSVKGEFYESELVHNAQHITRWRDWVDNLVVHYFLNPKALRGRLLALWTEKGKGELVKTAH